MRKLVTIPIFSIVLIVLLAVGGYLWLTQSSWLRYRIESGFAKTLAKTTDLEVHLPAMSGNLYSGVQFTGAFLLHRHDGIADTVVQIERITLNYDLRNLLAERRSVRRIEIDRPLIWIPSDSVEGLFRKAGAEVAAVTGIEKPLDVALDSVIIRDGIIRKQLDSSVIADSIQIDASFSLGKDAWALAISNSSARTPWGERLHFDGRMASSGPSWRFDSLNVRATKSFMLMSGTLDSVFIHTGHFDLAGLAPVTGADLTGQVRIIGDLQPALKAQTATGRFLVSGELEGYSIEDLIIRFAADSAGVTADSLLGTVSGAYFDGDGGLDWSVDPYAWRYSGFARGFNLARFASGTVPTTLTGDVDVVGSGVTTDDIRVTAELDLAPGVIDDLRFQSARGTITATIDSLWIHEGFALVSQGALFGAEGTAAFDDSIDVFATIRSDDLRAFDPLVFIDSLSGRLEGQVYLSGLTKDPDLSAFVTSDTLRLFDLTTADFTGSVSVPHFLTNPAGQIDARWGPSSTWRFATDSIELHARLAGRRIEIDSARWYSANTDIEGAGTLDWSADTIPLSLYPFTIRWEDQTYSADDSVRLTIDEKGFTFQPFLFEGPLGILNASGRIAYSTDMMLDFDVDQFRIGKVWERFFPEWQLDGVASVRGRTFGTFKDPRFELSGEVSDLEFENEQLGDLEGEVSYNDLVLQVDRAELDNEFLHASASGTVPIDLSFEKVEQRILDGPLTGRLEASGENLDPINRFLPQVVESVQGRFSISAGVTGTPRSPRFFGEASLRDGTIKAIEVVNPLEDVVLDLALRHDTVIVREAHGVMRDKKLLGTIDVRGKMHIISFTKYSHDLAIVGTGVPARLEFKDFFVVSDFNLTVIGANPPQVAGSVYPSRVEDREPFTETEISPVYDPALWDWDLRIEMPSGGYSIRNDQVEAELSAALAMRREGGRIGFLGTADFIRGKVYLFDKVGRITRGSLIFDEATSTDPKLDIDVSFRIQQPRVATVASESQSSPFVDLKLHIAGRVSEPQIQPEAPYTEQDVLLLFAANRTGLVSDSLGPSDPLADRLRIGATGLLFSEVQRLAARKLGVETFEINAGDNFYGSTVTVGRYFSPQLYLYGTTPFDAGTGQEVGFEYRFSRQVYMDGIRDKNNLYRLNLHFNWEY